MTTQRPHVLVIDDCLTVRMSLRELLTGQGFGVTLCEDLAGARHALETGRFGLIIVDVLLPDGDGIDLLGALTADPQWSATPVIVLSTEAEVHDRVRGLRTGAVEYIGKPYDPTFLLQSVLRWTGVQDESQLRRGVGGRKVLAVDDNPSFLRMLVAVLRHDRHEVVVARSGEEALEILAMQPVDCIILDMVMPGIDGFETCRRIKANPDRRDIPVLMLTGNDNGDARARGVAAGIEDYVIKSPRLDSVRVRVRMALRRGRTRHGRIGGIGHKPVAADGATRPPERTGSSFIDQLIAASGLSSQLARSVLARACADHGVETISPAELLKSLPSIREALHTYLSHAEATKRAGAMAAVARLAQIQHTHGHMPAKAIG